MTGALLGEPRITNRMLLSMTGTTQRFQTGAVLNEKYTMNDITLLLATGDTVVTIPSISLCMCRPCDECVTGREVFLDSVPFLGRRLPFLH